MNPDRSVDKTISHHIHNPKIIYVNFRLQASHTSFNPLLRRKNSRVRWFETELTEFYNFVEAQQLLNHEQEKKYGKAIRMWTQIESARERLAQEAIVSATSTIDPQTQVSSTSIIRGRKVSDEELAAALGCSASTIQKMSKYAQISKIKLVNGNLKLVMAVVSRYRQSNIPNIELISEGVRGLARAAMRFDYTKGFRFATYATWYVHQAVAEYARTRRNLAKMPGKYLVMIRRVKQFSADYKEEHNRFPTIPEIADALKESRFDVIKVLSMQIYPTSTSLKINKQTSKESKDMTVEDCIKSEIKGPSAISWSADMRSSLEQLMESNLNDVEKDVLRLRLGLDDGKEKALKEVGRHFQITWKQVKNMERDALSKLSVSDELPDFVDSYHSVA
jgi:RNA polymerase primary sigma factor